MLILASQLIHDEGFEMSKRKASPSWIGRAAVAATIAALAFAMAEPTTAVAGSVEAASTGVASIAQSSDATDFGARRRRYYRGGNAAGLAMMGMMIGTIGAIAAQQRREDYYYYGPGYYGYGPGYYGPRYYGYGPYYYGPRYYRYYPY